MGSVLVALMGVALVSAGVVAWRRGVETDRSAGAGGTELVR